MSALILVAFAFDGWVIASSISGEIPNPKRNMPLALILGCSGITLIYILYFIGISNLLGAQAIIVAGDAHVNDAAQKVFSTYGGKLLTFFIVISVYGTLNGLILAAIRIPTVLVTNNLMQDSFRVSQDKIKSGFSVGSILFSIIPTAFFLMIHMLSTIKGNYLNTVKFDVSSLPIMIMYVFYIILYCGVFKLIKAKQTPKIYYFFISIACIISAIILYGSLQKNALLYSLISFIILGLGLPFYKKIN